jgi:hypothetical protein
MSAAITSEGKEYRSTIGPIRLRGCHGGYVLAKGGRSVTDA